MRTFAQPAKAARPAVRARSPIPDWTRVGNSREVGTILRSRRTSGDPKAAPPKDGDKKAELEFHSTIVFNSPRSGSSSTGPSKEGFAFVEIQWTVWNSGFETAPEHVDRVTIYRTDRCSGCRAEKDEFLSADVTVPPTAPITQADEEFRYVATTALMGTTWPAGFYEAYVDLDVHDEVEEINESNNTLFTTWRVEPSNEPESPD